jgi:hypothetical protein
MRNQLVGAPDVWFHRVRARAIITHEGGVIGGVSAPVKLGSEPEK